MSRHQDIVEVIFFVIVVELGGVVDEKAGKVQEENTGE